MAISPDILEKLHTPEEDLQLDLSWLRPDDAGKVERVLPGRRGLTFDEIEAGRQVPEHAETSTLLPRDARARKDAPRTGMYYADKADVWSENSRLLYEEAVQRQWSSATDIPWETVQPLPDDVERAMCQLCTFLTEVEFIAGDAPGQWLPRINPDHYEAKLFLLTQIMDEARHLDVFRKRALANGGGLLAEGQSGPSLRVILDAKDFTEMSAIMHVFAEGFVQSLFRTGEHVSHNEAEKRIYRLCAQDESRHLAFGVMHLKYILETEPWRRGRDPPLPGPGGGPALHGHYQRLQRHAVLRRGDDRPRRRRPEGRRRGVREADGHPQAPDQRVHAPAGGGWHGRAAGAHEPVVPGLPGPAQELAPRSASEANFIGLPTARVLP